MYLGDKESFKIGDIVSNDKHDNMTVINVFDSEKDTYNGHPIKQLISKKYLTEDTEVYLVTRPYLTRHGNGYEPKYGELVNNTFTLEEPTNLDSGYQGKFKRGIFDVDLLNIAIKRHNLLDYNVEYNLVLTHMDCVKHDYIYFLNKEEIYGGSVDSFLIAINNNLNLKFSRNIYSYSE